MGLAAIARRQRLGPRGGALGGQQQRTWSRGEEQQHQALLGELPGHESMRVVAADVHNQAGAAGGDRCGAKHSVLAGQHAAAATAIGSTGAIP